MTPPVRRHPARSEHCSQVQMLVLGFGDRARQGKQRTRSMDQPGAAVSSRRKWRWGQAEGNAAMGAKGQRQDWALSAVFLSILVQASVSPTGPGGKDARTGVSEARQCTQSLDGC